MCMDAKDKKPREHYIWPYEAIEMLVVRTRSQHLDVRFKENKWPRFRLCTAHIQAVVNEFSLRCSTPTRELKVVFEPGTKVFQYGNPALSHVALDRKQQPLFRRAVAPETALPPTLASAPKEVKQGVLEQEADLNEISSILADLTGIAETMSTELDRQNEHLDTITHKVDTASAKMDRTNRRIDKLL